MDSLPIDVLYMIYSYFDDADIANITSTCSKSRGDLIGYMGLSNKYTIGNVYPDVVSPQHIILENKDFDDSDKLLKLINGSLCKMHIQCNVNCFSYGIDDHMNSRYLSICKIDSRHFVDLRCHMQDGRTDIVVKLLYGGPEYDDSPNEILSKIVKRVDLLRLYNVNFIEARIISSHTKSNTKEGPLHDSNYQIIINRKEGTSYCGNDIVICGTAHINMHYRIRIWKDSQSYSAMDYREKYELVDSIYYNMPQFLNMTRGIVNNIQMITLHSFNMYNYSAIDLSMFENLISLDIDSSINEHKVKLNNKLQNFKSNGGHNITIMEYPRTIEVVMINDGLDYLLQHVNEVDLQIICESGIHIAVYIKNKEDNILIVNMKNISQHVAIFVEKCLMQHGKFKSIRFEKPNELIQHILTWLNTTYSNPNYIPLLLKRLYDIDIQYCQKYIQLKKLLSMFEEGLYDTVD